MDFLGSTTPADLTASVTSGVQSTGSSLWPLLIFVGVPVAFAIGAMLISFIRHSVGKSRR